MREVNERRAMPDSTIEAIAAILAGLPLAEKQRLLIGAFKHALVERPT